MSEANLDRPGDVTGGLAPSPVPVAADVDRAPTSAVNEPADRSGSVVSPGARRRRGSRGGAKGRKTPGDRSLEADTGAAAGASRRAKSPVAPLEARRPQIGDARPASRPVRPGPSETGLSEPEPGEPWSAHPVPVAGESKGASPGSGSASARRRRRRGGRGTTASGSIAGVSDRSEERSVDLDEEALRRRGRERKGRPVGRYLMCVQVRPGITQIAVLEGRSLISHFVSRSADDTQQIDGNVYLGRVQNVLPGMEAAFVDIGTPKNAVLYASDLQHPEAENEGSPGDRAGSDQSDADGSEADSTDGRRSGPSGRNKQSQSRIEDVLRPGQTILCQVTKNPIGTKGARLTQEVSLPGRFVVMVPGSSTHGISKRLADDERKRLRRILDDMRLEGHGLIVRTAAEGATAEELRRDVERLLRQWRQIEGLAAKTSAPKLLSREPAMAVRVIREEFGRDYRGVIIDDRALFDDVSDYVGALVPELSDRIELYDQTDLSLFERQHVAEQLHKALDRKVWLPSGGSLIIERTEALTVIDVNTGRNVGRSNLEETVFANNVEAAEEIARQLRLRDIGGIIVIDFIDMEIRKNREEVVRVLKEGLARDKTRTQVFDIGELGLVQMTRKRVSEGLVESFSVTCPTCAGRGIVLDGSLL